MSQLDSARLPTVADFLPAEKARELTDLLRTVHGRASGREVEIRDETGGLLGRFVPAPPSTAIDPEFLEELRRRMENPSPEPLVPVEEVLAYLDSVERGLDVKPN